MIKKIVCLLLCLLLIFTVGCSSAQEDVGEETPQGGTASTLSGELQLLYCANDTMNPYKTISKLNAELGLLLYDSLVKYNNEFETENYLASSITFEDKVCTVSIKDAVFSDGAKLTSRDVLYSYNLAKDSTRYSSFFYEVSSVETPDDAHIVFTLNCADLYFANLLTFPIIKEGSDQLKNEDNVELAPIGSGRFVFDSKNAVLTKNTTHFLGNGNIEKITLINAPDSESMAHYVEIGATDIYFADSTDESIIRMDSQKVTVNRNNLIYLGVNHNYAPLKSDELRFAISAAISREDIKTKAFYSNAQVATGFFHPALKELSAYQSINPLSDEKISVENLAKIGYNKLNSDRYYENEAGKIVELSILVNSESASKVTAANLIAESLGAVGIKATVNAVDKNSYFSALKNGQFQLYIGEVKLLPNMDIRSLVVKGGAAAYGMVTVPVPQPSADAEAVTDEPIADEPYLDNETAYLSVIDGFYSGENTLSDLASSLLSSMPVIPLVYRNSFVFYSNEIESVYSPSFCDIFISVDKYIVKK